MIDPDEPKTPKRSLLVALRKRAKLTQQDLADRLGIRQKTISDWENGRATPGMPLSIYWQLSQQLGCSIEELVIAFEGEEALKRFPSGSSFESNKG